ncbi:MAG TPA: thiamine phosphate synthase, partial [Clostridiaceae bacterium]|nr:thiamine phosphate synthase [Clostridiaceae bacterium]
DPIGIEGLKDAVSSINIPSVAIGGINSANARSVLSTGVNGISVISAILNSEDIRKAAEILNK